MYAWTSIGQPPGQAGGLVQGRINYEQQQHQQHHHQQQQLFEHGLRPAAGALPGMYFISQSPGVVGMQHMLPPHPSQRTPPDDYQSDDRSLLPPFLHSVVVQPFSPSRIAVAVSHSPSPVT